MCFQNLEVKYISWTTHNIPGTTKLHLDLEKYAQNFA